MKHLLVLIISLLLLSLVTLSLTVKAAITNSSRVIPYQGRLTDSSGNNVADGTYSLTFKIYTVSSGGSASFTETNSSVSVSSGLFSVLLGSLSANGVNLDFANPPYYLGITVGANAEMSPRIQLGFAPLAHNAQYLDGTPLSSFELLGSTASRSAALIFSNTPTISTTAKQSLTFGDSNTGNIIFSGGNVGIGTTGPGAKLDIQATDSANLTALFADNRADSIAFIKVDSQYGSGRFGTYGNYAAILKDDTNYAYYYDSNNNYSILAGNVGIGTTSPGTKLEVNGSIMASGNGHIFINGQAEYQASNIYSFGTSMCYSTLGQAAGGYYSFGGCSSDGRLKHDINYLSNTSVLDKIKKLKPAQFKWNGTNVTKSGFIAQDVLPIIPEAIGINSDGYYSFDSNAILAYAVKAIQELQGKTEELKAENETLKQLVCLDNPQADICK